MDRYSIDTIKSLLHRLDDAKREINGIVPEENTSFDSYGLFSTADAKRLDRIKDALFKCFGASYVAGACAQMNKAKQLGEQCPFSEASLNDLFGRAE